MGISVRFYLFAADGSLRRFPKRIANELGIGAETIPDYAGTTQRIAQVVVDYEDGRPARIMDARGFFWTFDAEGHLDRDADRHFLDRIDEDERARRSRAGRVVSLVPEIKRKEQEVKEKWALTAEDLDRIAADLWHGLHGPAEEVTSVKGTKPKRPPLSYEAKDALRTIESKIEELKFELAKMSEHSLKGFEFEALRTATYEDEELWRAVAAAAKHQRDVLAAYRTGKGEWIACVEAFCSAGPIAERTAAKAHERCLTREAASEAGRRLMADKAGWLGPDTRLEVMICSALEWRDEEKD